MYSFIAREAFIASLESNRNIITMTLDGVHNVRTYNYKIPTRVAKQKRRTKKLCYFHFLNENEKRTKFWKQEEGEKWEEK